MVDYISFNIPSSDNTESIAKYLFEKFNFNSTFAKGQNGIPKSWFSGINAAQFYKIIQAQKFDWNILKSKNASLGRIDLHYFRKSKITDQSNLLENFMEKCCQRIRAKSKKYLISD